MPAGNGTGPMGMGPMTGRAAGYCAGYGAPGFMNPGYARAFAGIGRACPPAGYRIPWMRRGTWRGRGPGRGWGRGRWQF